MKDTVHRRRFEPVRFVLGLGLLALAVCHLLRERGDLDVSALALALLLPSVLLAALCVAGAKQLVRGARRRRGGGGGPPPLPDGR
ncbi:hypothetical protein [Streptomyces sp. GSL17-111]|uniref:hypothetical protein n=1 Tax=Streptomyces sp. GSL17-111 TaxID=3121596 RepID=UPI0030F38AA0